MAKIVCESPNPAHGTIDLIVEDAFGDRSHHSIHIGSMKKCPDCGHLQLHAGLDVEKSKEAKSSLLEWIRQLTEQKIAAFEAHGFDMKAVRAKLQQ